jgi:hypothetical protein
LPVSTTRSSGVYEFIFLLLLCPKDWYIVGTVEWRNK